jgi:polyhydroxyalkanoate synthase
MTGQSSDKDPFSQMLELQAEAAQAFFGQVMPGSDQGLPPIGEMQKWAENASKLQAMWLEFQAENGMPAPAAGVAGDPSQWFAMVDSWYRQMPFASPATQQALWSDSLSLWETVIGQFGLDPKAGEPAENPRMPREDRRFADPRWRQQPVFALIHQTYLMLAERLEATVDQIENLPEDKRKQLRFAARAMIDALSPANFPATNPVVLERTIESQGENLVKGMEHMLADLKNGQLSHTDTSKFVVGENIACTPGKVVHRTPLFEIIQYSPTTETVLEVPLLIFPPWINRFYILDLNPKKSFVRWAVEQGLTVFMVSWKSADASLVDIAWDDYIAAQSEAIDVVCKRLKVPHVHAIGYCVAGTTLAATLAVLAAKGDAAKVKSATFFTAQVDFEQAGELLNFVDDNQIATIERLSPEGYLDGRYMAATFNLLRGPDLIWNYVINNYLLGEEYPAFDLLYWNGDVTNLPAKWHIAYLRDLYRDNKLVQPGALSALGAPIDLRKVETPCYIQAGREDHIAPPKSVWKMTDQFSGPIRFVLAGSGHIAGVVNPPDANKYQYWTNDGEAASLEAFQAGATEHPGSWWPDWIDWIRTQDDREVKAKGKRKPGGKSDKVLGDAPGTYVKMR